MSLINTEIKPFKATAYHNGKFVPVTEREPQGQVVRRWCSIPPTSPSSARPSSAISPTTTRSSRNWAWRSTACRPTRTSPTRRGTTPRTQSPRCTTPWSAIRRRRWRAISSVLIEEDGLAYRGTFVINPEGLIKIIEVHDNGIGRDAKELLRKVKAAQYVASHPGEVCPAKWTPGAQTLEPSLDLVGQDLA